MIWGLGANMAFIKLTIAAAYDIATKIVSGDHATCATLSFLPKNSAKQRRNSLPHAVLSVAEPGAVEDFRREREVDG
jgi:hypothetical protein